jgi:hypothetical protein
MESVKMFYICIDFAWTPGLMRCANLPMTNVQNFPSCNSSSQISSLNFKTLKITEQQIAIGMQLTCNVCLLHQSQFMLNAENTIKTVCGSSYMYEH